MPKYQSPFSVDYRKPITLMSNDPRAKVENLGKYEARAGSEIIVVNSFEKPLTVTELFTKVPALVTYSSYNVYNDLAISSDSQYYYLLLGRQAATGGYYCKIQKFKTSDDSLVWQKIVNIYNYEPTNIDVDNTGNIYIHGVAGSSQTLYIIKLNSEGTMQWARYVSTALSGSVSTIDKNGNSYIVYRTYNTDPIRLIKIDKDGSSVWKKQYDFYAASDYSEYSITVSDDGSSIYVGQDSSSVGTFIIHKHSSNGSLTWSKQYTRSGSFSHILPKIVKITDSNIFVISQARTADSGDYPYLNKISTDGSFVNSFKLSTVYGYRSTIFDMDSSENFYFMDNNSAIYKFDNTGKSLWGIFAYQYKSGAIDSSTLSMLIDKNGKIHACGYDNHYPGPWSPFKFSFDALNPLQTATSKKYRWTIDTGTSLYLQAQSYAGRNAISSTLSVSTASYSVNDTSVTISSSSLSVSNATDTILTGFGKNKPTIV